MRLFASFFAILYQTMLYCPMCYYDWKVQRHNRSLSIRNIFLGLQDAHSKQRVTRRWKDWKNEWGGEFESCMERGSQALA